MVYIAFHTTKRIDSFTCSSNHKLLIKPFHYDVFDDRVEFREILLKDYRHNLKPCKSHKTSTFYNFNIHSIKLITGKYLISDENYKDGILTIWFEDVIK